MEGFNLNGFPFPNNSASSSYSSSSATSSNGSQANDDDATMKKIIEAIELLEKLAKNSEFPVEKLQEIKQELKKKYPNINFNPEKHNSQKPENPNNNNNNQSPHTSTLPNMFPNNPNSALDYFMNQINQRQQLNYAILQQTQMMNNKLMEQHMRRLGGVPWTYTNPAAYSAPSSNPFFGGGTYPSYHNLGSSYGQVFGVDPMKMVLENMGNFNNQGLTTDTAAFDATGSASSAFFGDDGGSSAAATALSFLGNLLGGAGF